MKAFLTLASLLILSSPGLAQTDVDHDFQNWIDISGYYQLNQKFFLGGDGGYRRGGDLQLGGLSWSTGYVRPTIRFDVSKEFSLKGGIALFYRFRPDLPDIFELRPWFGGQLEWPRLGPITLRHRIRLEQRYFRFRNQSAPFSLTRFRYQIGASVPLKSGKSSRSKSLYLPIKYEFFMHFQDTTTRKERFAGGLGYYLTDSFRIEAGYTADMLRSTPSKELLRVEHMLRIQFKY